jgi:hypothetical protein
LIPDWGIKSAKYSLAYWYDDPMPELTLSPSQGSMNSATVFPGQEIYALYILLVNLKHGIGFSKKFTRKKIFRH